MKARRAEDVRRLDYDAVAEAARRGGPPTADDVTVLSDGRRIDSAEKLRAVIEEFTRSQTEKSSAGVDR
jgi:hypothetical protein